MVKNKLHRYIVCIIIFSTVAAGYKIYTKNAKQNKKLYEAIETNDVEAAKEAIDDGANKNSFQSIILTMESISGKPDRNPVYADTVLHADNKIAQYLIEKGANTNYRDRDGISLLMLAAEQGNIKFCKQLIEKGADVGYKRKGESALDFALASSDIKDRKKQIELIEYLKQQKTPVTKVTKKILIKGYKSGVYGDVPNNIESLIEWGINHKIIEIKDLPKEQQIFYRISRGETIKSLKIKEKSIKKLYNMYHENIAMVATKYGNMEVLKYAMKNNISIRKKNSNDENILCLAIKSEDLETLKYIIKLVNPTQEKLCEAIEDTIDSISEETLSYLLTKMIDINISPDNNDENILETAATNDRRDLIETLIERDAIVTPMTLINAVHTRDIELVKILLENGGKINKIGKYSDGEKMDSILYTAIRIGDFSMVKFLIKNGATDIDIKEAVDDSNSYRIRRYIHKKFPEI